MASPEQTVRTATRPMLTLYCGGCEKLIAIDTRYSDGSSRMVSHKTGLDLQVTCPWCSEVYAVTVQARVLERLPAEREA